MVLLATYTSRLQLLLQGPAHNVGQVGRRR
ncbi:hypothetical protein CLV45_2929 [Hymenobacter chitinivorans DSM 11115]|uniref:Uncharacterized protein n=1 Tax=Hymenobacter chitinivorans DSM 11115 TaxID=1121954 RepID=A0A2M9B9G7_9BACT|nr:hypothetical protein CLV45_2929 [Hymenobacter chitinivorans DSM 11115]